MQHEDDDNDDGRTRSPWLRRALFVASAALFAGVVHGLWQYVPAASGFFLIPALALVAAYAVFRWWSHRRLVKMLRRGDVNEVISQWSHGFERIPHADTMAPLMTATAFAAFGRVVDARRALATAARGPAWEAALEHRLFLDALLSTFEGDAEYAGQQAAKLNALPMPDKTDLRERVGVLRQALAALVRAFQHCAEPGDLDRLEAASEKSPLVHWAMRYGAAIVAIDRGEKDKARALIDGAPRWPTESAFRGFHDEISEILAT